MTKQDWLLLALAAAKHDGLDPVQLQKSLFLFGEKGREFTGRTFYHFEPHNYGPFCAEIYHDADAFAARGYVSKQRRPGYSWATYRITDAGTAAAKTLSSGPAKAGAAYLQEVVDFVKRKSFYELVQLIYQLYPRFKSKSIFSS